MYHAFKLDTVKFLFQYKTCLTGDFPDIQVAGVMYSSSVTHSVTRDTRGVPDLDTAALKIDGIVSEPFSVASLDAGTVSIFYKATVTKMKTLKTFFKICLAH